MLKVNLKLAGISFKNVPVTVAEQTTDSLAYQVDAPIFERIYTSVRSHNQSVVDLDD
ncbi:nucleoside-diphosphate kinase [Ligilactobacillus sp. WC1T17]|uniref:nucleoside-diphosphate kinase n=1 Tax=Ligilactobacillus sp. WC1T17 TaxID=3158786 RepID=UPI00117A6D77